MYPVRYLLMKKFWNSNVLFEVKSGKQVDPIATRFYNAESQSQEFVDTLGTK